MLKFVVIILIIIAAVVLGQNYMETGKIGFNVSLSEDEVKVREFEEQLNDAMRGYRVAGRGSSIGGMAPDESVEDAAVRLRKLKNEITQFKRTVSDPTAKEKVEELERKVAAALAAAKAAC